jgi:kanosamine 6-kinase
MTFTSSSPTQTATGCLGIDFGGTKVAFRACTARPEVLEAAFRWPSAGGLEADLLEFDACWQELRARCAAPIGSVGVAVAATVNRDGRVAAWPSRPSWVGFDLSQFLLSRFPGATVRWADDGNLGALAEAHQANCCDLAYIGVGTGIGGGLVLGGRPYPCLQAGSELGHLVVDRRGAVCSCGRVGCVQATASGPATLSRAARLRGSPVSMAELRDGLTGDAPWAQSAVRETAAALATTVVNLSELLGLRLIRIGGGFAHQLAGLVPTVIGEADRLDRLAHAHAAIEPAAFGGLSSLAGALLLARQPALADRPLPDAPGADASSRQCAGC